MNESFFACPCIHKEVLKKEDSFYICSKTDCFHSKKENSFPIKENNPILISEVNTDTVFEYSKLSGAVKRQESSAIIQLRKLLLGENPITVNNCTRFINSVKASCSSAKILIIGGGEIGSGAHKLYDSGLEVICSDIYLSEHTNVIADAHYLPFKDSSFDGVWIQAVLEHVVDPNLVVKEIHRVLKKEGIVYSEIPFMQPVHEGRYDFTRFTTNGHRYLFKSFETLDLGPLRSPEDMLAWSLRYFFWSLFRSRFIAKIVGVMFSLILKPFSIILSKEGSYDSTTGTYFLGKKSEKTIKQKEALQYYKGHL